MKTKFTFLIFPQMHLLDLAGPDQAIHEAMDYGADFEIEYCTIDAAITTTAGLPIGTLKNFKECKMNPGDFIIIPGSNASYLMSSEFKKNTDVLEWIRTAYSNKVNVVSICAGAFALAETGLLDGITCTTHFKKTAELQKFYPKTKVQENILFTENNGIYTSAGIASGIDLMLHIIEQLKGSHFAHLVARELVVYMRRNGTDAQESDFLQFRKHIHVGIHKVQDWIFENLNKKTNLSELAEISAMSERNLTRIFKKETGLTINEYINVLRKERISELLKNPDLSKIEIANRVGLESEKQLGRILGK